VRSVPVKCVVVAGLLVGAVLALGMPRPDPTGSTRTLFGTIGNHVVRIDQATGAAADVGTTPAHANLEAMTYDGATGAVYGVADGTTDPKLIRVDVATGAATLVGSIDLANPSLDLHLAEALAFDPANGKLYAAVSEYGVPQGQSRSDRLVTVDPATGTATMVAMFSGVEEADAMEFVGGTLYVSNTAPPRTFLYTVDPATAAATLVGEVGFNHVADLAYNADTDTLFGTPHTDRVLIRISRTTGQGTVVGTTHAPQDFGGATLTALAVVPESPSCTYSVDQGTTHYTVTPVALAKGIAAFYDYTSASAHTPYVEAFASVLFLYKDTTTDRVYFVFHFNVDNGGSTDAKASADFLGIPSGASVAVSDDPGEFSLGRSLEGQFQYFLNTDGGALGPLPQGSDWAMKVTFTHFGIEPPNVQRWVDGNGTRLALAMNGVVTVASECNAKPHADAGGPYSGVEGSPITFNAGGSSDPDGDSLDYTWDFENDGVWDVTTTNATVQRTYPDDFNGTARLQVSDGILTDGTTAAVKVANVAPTIVFDFLSSPNLEGREVVLRYHGRDPGADLVDTFVDWGDGVVDHLTSMMGPITYIVEVHHTYGDDGSYPLVVTAKDDDGGVGTLVGILAVVDNAPPSLVAVSFPAVADEGATVALAATAQDPGSDDLSFVVDFGNGDVQRTIAYNDGVGPDPSPSPGGTFPFVAGETFTTRYVQNGDYTAHLAVTDDDGGTVSVDAPVHVNNVGPTIEPFGPAGGVEGAPGAITATATDPGNDSLTFVWTFELGPTVSHAFPATGSPMTATGTADFLYGDDGSYAVRLTVTDQDGASATWETTIEVANLPPTASIVQVHRMGNLTLRVAGEKWHDVAAVFYGNDSEIARLSVVRSPGSPDEQAATTDDLDFALPLRYTAKVLYTPADDPVNGQPNGANPVWIIVRAPGGEELRIHHTFNVEHPGTYEWDVDLTPYLAQLAVRFSAAASDPGSDDLTFTWDFGDGTPAVSTTVFNDGVAPDAPKSPGGTFPFTATATAAHGFPGPGTYVVTLTVTDDDGGSTTATMTITILG